jgi:hypothetical protein
MKSRSLALWALFVIGCASTDRECAQCGTEIHGANWLVVQLKNNGDISRCWKLEGVAVANESGSDGIWWVSGGQQVHISGWYNYVQVSDWNEAAKILGVDLPRCTGGSYVSPELPEAGK